MDAVGSVGRNAAAELKYVCEHSLIFLALRIYQLTGDLRLIVSTDIRILHLVGRTASDVRAMVSSIAVRKRKP